MNLYELLLNECALGNKSARCAITAQFLTGKMPALVTIYPDTPSDMNTSSRIRYALGGQSKSYQTSPLNVPKFRKVLESMAIGNDPDIDALRLIEVVGSATAAAKVEAVPAKSAIDVIPGKMPRTAIGKIAIKAAWEIESDTGKPATANNVILKLQKSVETEPLLIKSIPYGVVWVTTKKSEVNYKIDACGKALKIWNASRA